MLRIRTQAGFTLLELVVVMAIAAILLAAAIPQFQQMAVASARAQGGTLMLSAFNQARSEAIARNGNVVVCRRNYFTSSTFPVCDMSTSGTWAQGWIVYRDSDTSIDSAEPDAAADIIAVFEPVGRVTATGEGNAFTIVPAGNPAYLVFASNGRATQALSFTLCDASHRLSDSRRVEIAPSGYVSLRALDATTTASLCG
ncbi:MAG: hypothetical protein JWQ90_1253 [Hydrocarboniphaga sp.]|uniref:GspH/FimT family pseudopilin n=1 Tax=Hydrocarboniphaga sp. TaxID=2033016 RepID=UPI0026149AA0|nr:GspH/FimT family protein [Hydrocarboniphaga sp.]MDB5968803.1 hypothetical protein [Hydrocarboniphaga sp.]